MMSKNKDKKMARVSLSIMELLKTQYSNVYSVYTKSEKKKVFVVEMCVSKTGFEPYRFSTPIGYFISQIHKISQSGFES
jgi:hypothetical protein